MCKSLIKKVTKIKKGVAFVGAEPIQILVNDIKKGDNVLVYGNLAIRKIDNEEIKEIAKYEA